MRRCSLGGSMFWCIHRSTLCRAGGRTACHASDHRARQLLAGGGIRGGKATRGGQGAAEDAGAGGAAASPASCFEMPARAARCGWRAPAAHCSAGGMGVGAGRGSEGVGSERGAGAELGFGSGPCGQTAGCTPRPGSGRCGTACGTSGRPSCSVGQPAAGRHDSRERGGWRPTPPVPCALRAFPTPAPRNPQPHQ